MANVDAKLKVAELDFDTIKSNLKQFMKSQSEFSDYDFEGSGLSVLLDVLAYNTHYMGYYLNMVSNEMFIDTAINRNSVVSHAKLLGYTPRSRVAARAAINLTISPVPNDSNNAVLIPRFTRFSSETKDGVNYIFVNPNARVVPKNPTSGLFFVENLELKEGQPNGITFTYDEQTNPKQIFELPDTGIDTSTIQVFVQRSAENANQESYILAEDATNVLSDSNVYYLEENKNGKYQIYFGDGVIGKKLTNGNIVVVSYVITSGIPANGLRTFQLLDNLLNGAGYSVQLVSASTSGASEESIDNIRFTAPKAYISQNRAVTKNDYIALINKNYPYFEAVNVWGGEENDPPVYGKVFFTAKPLGGYEIGAAEVDYVKNNILKPFSILTVTPEYVEADYTYVNIVSDVYYNPTKTNKNLSEIQAVVVGAIQKFAATNLNTFNSTFRVSQLSRAVDDCEDSISSNDIKLVLEKRFAPDTTKTLSYKLDFGTELKQGTTKERLVSSPSFKYYDSLGTLRDCYIEEVIQSYTGIESIDVVNPGSGYKTTPTVTISGDGTGATARAIIVNGALQKIEVLTTGTGYTSATVLITDGSGGAGATGKVNLQGRTGKLRIYYYDSQQIKKSITEDIGTIDYLTGVISLNNFQPISVADPFGTMILKTVPAKKVFASSRNRIVTLDLTDPGAVSAQVYSTVET